MKTHLSRRSTALASALGILLASAAPTFAQGGAWKTLAPANGGFSVSMPGTPKAQRKATKSKEGLQTVEQDYELETDSGLFKLSYQEHEAKFARLINPSELLDEVSDAALKEMGAKETKAKKIALNGFEGRDASAKIQGANIRMRVFWAGRRLYIQMAAFTDDGKASADKFVSSLKLSKPQPK